MVVAFEGPSHAGKSTTRRALTTELSRGGVSVLEISHAGILGSHLQSLTISKGHLLDPIESLLLYGTRLSLNAGVATRSLAEDPHRIILLDRFVTSLLVLGHHMMGLPREMVDSVLSIAARDLRADATVFLDISHEEQLRRGGNLDYATHERYREAFRNEYRLHSGSKLFIDFCGQSAERCALMILAQLEIGI